MKIVKILLAPLDFVLKYFKVLVLLLVLYLVFAPFDTNLNPPNLARIDLKGMIVESDEFLEELESLADNDEIKGILLVINSPGGAIAPSIEISEAIKELHEYKPVVAYAQGVMASGSYYAGMWANTIVANRGSLIGSIGVIIQGFEIGELMQKIGIKPQIIKEGRYKEIGTFVRPWNEDEEEMMRHLVKEQYDMFVKDVAEARELDINNQDHYAQGRIFSAKNAMELKLIDQIGDIHDAQAALMVLSGVKEPIWLKKDGLTLFIQKLNNDLRLAFENAITSTLQGLR